MARYIDAERLSREVISSWDKDKHVTLEASRVHRQEHHHLMRIIEKQPTADVVPKSEVDWLYQTVDNYSQEVMYYDDITKMKVDEAKSEVAREIFEEIEKIATAEGAYDYVSIQEIAELKKKYTEEKE